jgi:hypothetical protein
MDTNGEEPVNIRIKSSELDLILEALEENHASLSDSADNLPKVRAINVLCNKLEAKQAQLAAIAFGQQQAAIGALSAHRPVQEPETTR